MGAFGSEAELMNAATERILERERLKDEVVEAAKAWHKHPTERGYRRDLYCAIDALGAFEKGEK